MKTYYDNPADAIARSISYDERTIYTGSLVDVISYAESQGYETGSAQENNGSIDVWGWKADTPEFAQNWRVLVLSAQQAVNIEIVPPDDDSET